MSFPSRVLPAIGTRVSPITALFADGADGLNLDFSDLSKLSQDTAGATPVTTIGQVIGRAVDEHSTTVFNNATQATAGFKPAYQADGAKFDGTDDYLATSYVAGSGPNCMVALVTVPASLAGTQIIAGANAAGETNAFRFGFTVGGALRGAVGGGASLDGAVDHRGTSVVVALSCTGADVEIFGDAASLGTQVQSGAPSTVISFIAGGRMNNATPASFFGGSIKRLLVARKALTLSDYLAIRAQLLAGG